MMKIKYITDINISFFNCIWLKRLCEGFYSWKLPTTCSFYSNNLLLLITQNKDFILTQNIIIFLLRFLLASKVRGVFFVLFLRLLCFNLYIFLHYEYRKHKTMVKIMYCLSLHNTGRFNLNITFYFKL